VKQCEALAKFCELSVMSPVPWYPGSSLLSRYNHWRQDFSAVPRQETIQGLPVSHPRFLHIPRLLWPRAANYALSLLPALAKECRELDAVLATWAYPDGVAGVLLGQLLGIPVYVQVIGTDIDVLAERGATRWQLGWALPRAAGIIAVSRQLGERAVQLGAPAERVSVVRTGLDRNVFKPADRGSARQVLGVESDTRLILYVGRLNRDKGLNELLGAFHSLAAIEQRAGLVIIGDGPMKRELEQHARTAPSRIRLLGELAPTRIAEWLAAANLLALPSHHEGTPNVILEALSCGRKVVASNVGGIPDLLNSSAQGELVPPRDEPRLCRALQRVLAEPYDEESVLASVELYDWDENARRLLRLMDATVQPARC
jgi:teichuronic acid biosynthesis glycosyltransferase TuaC